MPVHDRLRAGGIPEGGIKTTGYDLQPGWDYSNNPSVPRGAGMREDAIKTTVYDLQPDWDYSNNRRVLRGYVARNTIDVRIDDVDRVGELLDMAVNAGATAVENIRFDLKDRERLQREALRLARAEGRER